MSMPYRLFDLTAYFSLIGVIFGLGVLSDNGELIGARILGKSYISIAISAFKPVFILILIVRNQLQKICSAPKKS